jgi:phosphohistidine phosphatase SixA
LIHTAEGEFFRQAYRHAFESLELPVIGIRERDLDERAQKAFGKLAAQVRKNIDSMGRILGPPWTRDEKTAALAAAIVLAETSNHPKTRPVQARGA